MTRKNMLKNLFGAGAVLGTAAVAKASDVWRDNGTGATANGWVGHINQVQLSTAPQRIVTQIAVAKPEGYVVPGPIGRVANPPIVTEYRVVTSGPYQVNLVINGRNVDEPGLILLSSLYAARTINGEFEYFV